MALIVMCGQPCSGKSTAAQRLAHAITASDSDSKPRTVKIVGDASFHLDRNQSYADMPSEKNLRGVLRSEVDRSLTADAVIIVDSLNSIKGYRYELWCLARAAGIRYCVVFCDAPASDCRGWNQERCQRGEPGYEDRVFDDLASRFERPERRNRWDSPLFEICSGRASEVEAEAVNYVTKQVDSRTRDVRVLQPTIATQTAKVAPANSLYELDRAAQEVMAALMEAQARAMGAPLRGVSLGPGLPELCAARAVGMPELRQLRKTFIKLTGQTSLSGPPPPSDTESAKRMFVDYLNRELGSH